MTRMLFITKFDAISMNVDFVIIIFLCSALLLLMIVDIKTYCLPDIITLPLLWIGLLLNVDGHFVSIRSAIYGAISGYLFLWFLYWLCRYTLNKEGIGYGDLKLTAAIGAWLGVEMIPLLMLMASLSGLFGFTMMSLKRKSFPEFIAFGPYLCLSAMVLIGYNFAKENWIN
ncbi:Bifunctional prepilin peptidase: leader peptidase; methyl transferase (General Secretory Pathway) [Xenorhabdus poinarii G6]|uniref:Bifunctional prepilin peptidase: leader peptidase methyl transferase (General Secretory Pathway) n=2 Tax=Xenorhabdus poinarii TaxID=40577 RepID=A0A068R7T9_9GAMM|nr:Bifunctional prepilin peptidase: leader peptidase; methyl transferase (General Secretory Pathway) [Xenorhabdus poinarii G6]